MNRTMRILTLAEIGVLLDWAAAEGWNPGLYDAAAFQTADPSGFFGAFVDDQMVAAIAAVAYDDSFGFIGLYICHPHWRGQGHGKAVWDAGMAYLGNRTIGLDGVPAQQANYASMGFVPAYETIRMSAMRPVASPGQGIAAVGSLDEIASLDRRCFPALRENFLRHWIAPPRHALAHASQGTVDAYGVSRQCREGIKIGPLFARRQDDAMAILGMQSGLVHLDVPAGQTEWLAALSSIGFSAGFRTCRMYRNGPPELDMSSVFAVTSLELG